MPATIRITKNLPVLFLVVCVLVFIAACSSGRKSLERGDYDKAVRQAVKKLRSDTDNEKASATLEKAYPLFIKTRIRNITAAKNSPDPLRWERVLEEYQAINSLNDEILHCPACLDHIPEPELVTNELNDARVNAAATRYEMGTEALAQKELRHKAIDAYHHFTKALELMPGYRDSEILIEEALQHARLNVVVEPLPSPQVLSNLDHAFFTNKLNEYLRETEINPFVCFYTPEQAETLNIGWIDHRIRMRFEEFSLGNVNSKTSIEEISRDSVLLNPKDEKKIYGEVSAKLTRHEKSMLGSGLLDFQILDQEQNLVLTQEKFSSEFRWVTQWASFNGDERALSEEQQKLVKQKEIPLPNPQYIFQELAVPLYDQVVRKINRFYRDYEKNHS